MTKLIGLDYGEKNIGVAFGDSDLQLAVPRPPILNTNFQEVLTKLQAIIDTDQIEKIIVGLPITLSGAPSDQTAITLTFVKKLSNHLEIPVHSHEERLTTVEAEKLLSEEKNLQEGDIDSVAAQIILQNYLNSL